MDEREMPIDELYEAAYRAFCAIGEVLPAPKVIRDAIPAADVNEVMQEQLDYLIMHAYCGIKGCPDCLVYKRVRALLLRSFGASV